jgi:hypothetical protein
MDSAAYSRSVQGLAISHVVPQPVRVAPGRTLADHQKRYSGKVTFGMNAVRLGAVPKS